MGLAVIKKHIFTGCSSIPEAIADIKAERHSVHQTGSTAPVPGIFIGPHPSAPIQNAEGLRGTKLVNAAIKFHLAGSRHAVDFLIIIERRFLFRKRGADHHGLLLGIFQANLTGNRFTVTEVIHVKAEQPVITPVKEFQTVVFL